MKQGSVKISYFQLRVQEEGWVTAEEWLRARKSKRDNPAVREKKKKRACDSQRYRENGEKRETGWIVVIMAAKRAPSPPLERAPLTLTASETDYLPLTHTHAPVCVHGETTITCIKDTHTRSHIKLLLMCRDKQKKGKVIPHDSVCLCLGGSQHGENCFSHINFFLSSPIFLFFSANQPHTHCLLLHQITLS